MDERDITFKKYREQQEAFKNAEIRLKYEMSKEEDPTGFEEMLGVSGAAAQAEEVEDT